MSRKTLNPGAGAQTVHRRLGGEPQQLGTAVVLVAIWLVIMLGTGLLEPRFLRLETFTALSFSVVTIMPLCVGLAIVAISGSGLDLSVGVVASITTLICAHLLTEGQPGLLVIGICLGFGIAFGALNGFLVAVLGLDPVVATLSTNFIGIGIVGLSSVVLSMPAESILRTFAFESPIGVTNLVWVSLALVILADVFLRKTRGGRHVLGIGGNAIAAQRQGISRLRVRLLAFVFSGLMAATAGLSLAASSDAVRGDVSAGRSFQAISAVLLAGIMLAGGRGRLLGLIPAVLVIVSIPTAIVTLGVTGAWSLVVQGAVLAVALAIDGLRSRRSTFT